MNKRSSSHLYKHMSKANFFGLFEKGLEMPLQSSACSRPGHARPCPGGSSLLSCLPVHHLSVFPLPFTFFHHLLKTSPASSSPHCSLKIQAHFLPPHHIYHWSCGTKKMFSFQRCRHFLAYEKTSSLLSSTK